MKIAIFGASGRIGSQIVNEALNRGHEVTAVGSTEAAVEALESDSFDLAITDLLMPGGGGSGNPSAGLTSDLSLREAWGGIWETALPPRSLKEFSSRGWS